MYNLSKGCDILIVILGRMLDFLLKLPRIMDKKQLLSLSRLYIIVYDEANKLLSMDDGKERSFEDEIDVIDEMLFRDRDKDCYIYH